MKKEYQFILAMMIFGTIGPVVKIIPLDSTTIALLRALLASIFLMIVVFKKGLYRYSLKEFGLIGISGAMIGLNWIFLFESYHYISVANATLIYYLAPMLSYVGAIIFFKEKVTLKNVGLLLLSFIGFLLVTQIESDYSALGILFAFMAALLYASVICLNRFLKNGSAIDRTCGQFIVAALVLLPYSFIYGLNLEALSLTSFVALIILGLVHTGLAYVLYFDAMVQLPSIKIALYSYIDPLLSVVLSIVLLKEGFSYLTILGMCCILLASFLNERT